MSINRVNAFKGLENRDRGRTKTIREIDEIDSDH
jgi:hypothetical protein